VTALEQRSPAPDALRLQCRVPGAHDGFVDGSWWPRSLDLRAELPRLLTAFRSSGHEVARIAYRPAAWDPAPATLVVSGRTITLDKAPHQVPELIGLLDDAGVTRADLVVIPPLTERRAAERVLALGRRGGDLRRLVGIIERAADPYSLPAALDQLPAAVWETEGGRILAR